MMSPSCNKTTAFTVLTIHAVIVLIVGYFTTTTSRAPVYLPTQSTDTTTNPQRPQYSSSSNVTVEVKVRNATSHVTVVNGSSDPNVTLRRGNSSSNSYMVHDNGSLIFSVLDTVKDHVGRLFVEPQVPKLKPKRNPTGLIGIDQFPNLIKKYKVNKSSAPNLERVVSEKDYATLIQLVNLTTRLFEEQNISYVLAYGSLIGSYLMHDLLPWDDDVDIFIHNNSKAKAMNLFKDPRPDGITGYHYHQSSGQLFKIFFNSSAHAGGYTWKWPFIDLVTYVHKGSSIVPVEKAASGRVAVPKKFFYPFHKRPFGPLWLNSPHNPPEVLKRKYKQFVCRSGFWNHQKETNRKVVTQSCQQIHKYYPFVERSQHGNRTQEALNLGGKVLYKVVIDEAYKKQKSKFSW